ncbi:MAG: hypothetical protein ABIT47_01620 [Candidatus Paceibacterota bacterium]
MGENRKRARIGISGLGIVILVLSFGAYAQANSAPIAQHDQMPYLATPDMAKQ